MISVVAEYVSLLGPKERFRPASPDSWRSVEQWIGSELPADYKELIDGYGDAVLLGHLFLPHPQGSDPLLDFMREERISFHHAYADQRQFAEALEPVWDRVVPWAYHDWNGDVCLLVPSWDEGDWAVAVALRQCPRIEVFDGGVEDFMRALLREGRLPAGWPSGEPVWESVDGSPLI